MSADLKVRVKTSLKRRMVRDARATLRSLQTISSVALEHFYNLPIPERSAILLRAPRMQKGRRA